MGTEEVQAALERIYAVPREEFVAARGAAVKELKAAGDGEAAAVVGSARKPTVAAWAVNQLRRRERRRLARFLGLADELEAAQRALIEEGDRDSFTDAAEAFRKALGDLVERAARLVVKAGGKRGPALEERIENTLNVAASDPEARELVAAGRLDRERSATAGLPGLEALAGAKSTGGKRRRRPAKSKPAAARKRLERERAKAGDADAELERAEEALEDAREAEREAAAGVRRAQTAVRNAKAKAARAAERVAALESELERS
jgi:hypothetical protein